MTGLFSGVSLGESESSSKSTPVGENTFVAEFEGKYYLVPYEDDQDSAAAEFITGKLPPVGQAGSYDAIRKIQLERQKWGPITKSTPPTNPGPVASSGLFAGKSLDTPQPFSGPSTYLEDFINRATDPNNLLGAVEAPLTAANQFITGAAAMPAEWLSAGKSLALDTISGRTFEPGLGGWEGAKQRAFNKGQEAAADVQRVLGYEPKTPAGQQQAENVGKIFETGEKAIATLANIKGDLYKPLGLKSIEKDDPIAAHYLSQIAFVMGLKAGHSTVKGTKAKYNAWKDKVEQAKNSGNLPDDFREIEKVANEEASKRADAAFEKARQEMELAIATNKNFAVPKETPSSRQYTINRTKSDAEAARPSLEDIARKRQEQIYQEMPDLPAQPPSTVEQPISQRTQGQEVAKINQMVKPPLTPEQKTAEAIRRGQIPQTPPETSPMPETTLAPEPRTDYRYPKPPTPIMAPEKIRNLLPNENDLYRKIFVTPDKKAPAVKNLQQQPKPLADLTQEEISKMSPAERAKAVLEAEGVEVTPEMVEQGARAAGKIQEDLAKKAASPTISQVAPEKGVTPSGEAATQPKVKVPETKLTNDMRALGWTDAQIKEFSLGERKQVVKDQSRPEPREQDSFASKADKELFEKYIAEKPSTNYTPETGEAALKALVPEATRWINGDATVDINALREKIQGIASQFDPNNLSHDRVTLPADKLLAELSRIEMERSGIKIPEVTEEIDWYGEGGKNAKETGTQAKATSEGEGSEGRKGKRIRVRNAEEDRVEAQGGEVRQGWRERRQALVEQGRIKTRQHVDATIKYERATRDLKGVDEAWKEWALRDPEGFKKFNQEETRRALDLDIPEEAVDARDFMGAIRDILGNERGGWSTRKKNPLERLTTLDIGAIDKIYKVARTTGMKASDLMKEAGISDETIALAEKIHATHIEPLRAKNLTPILQGPYKDRNPADVIKQGKPRMYKGQLITQPPVMRDLTELIANTPDIKGTAFESWRTPIHTFEMLPKELKERLYTTERHLEHQSNVEFKEFRDELKTVAKGLSRKNLRNVSIYGQLQQEGGAELIKALGLKEVKALTPKEKTLYDHLIKMGARAFIEQNEVRTAVGKNPLKNEPNYFTRMRSFSLAERLGLKHNHILMDEADIMANDAMHAGAAFPYSHRRARLNTQALDLDPVAVAEKYMRAHINYKNLTPFIAELQKTLEPFQAMSEAKGTKGFVPKYHKPGLTKFLTKWADYVGGTYEPPLSPAMNTALGILNKNAAFATLSNLTTAAYQPAGLVTVGALTGPRFIAQGIAKAIDPFEKTSVRQSKLLFSRAADLSYTDNSISLGKFHEKAGNAGLWLMKQMDYITAKASFIAARDYALNKGLGMKDAINWADDVVAKTQGSTMKGDTAPIQRSNLGRTATLFQTFVIANWNTLLRDVSGVLGDKPLVAKKGDLSAGTARTALRFVVGAAMANSLYDALGMRKPYPSPISTVLEGVENDDRPFKIAWDTLKESAEMMPLAGNVKFGGSFLSKPIVTLHNLMTGGPHRKTVQAELENLEEEGEFPPFIGESVGTLLGVPGTGQIAKSTRAAKRGEEGFWDLAVGRFQK